MLIFKSYYFLWMHAPNAITYHCRCKGCWETVGFHSGLSDLSVASTQNPELLVLVMGRPHLCTTPSWESALHNVWNRILKYAAANWRVEIEIESGERKWPRNIRLHDKAGDTTRCLRRSNAEAVEEGRKPTAAQCFRCNHDIQSSKARCRSALSCFFSQ